MDLESNLNTKSAIKNLKYEVIIESILKECIIKQSYNGEIRRLALHKPVRYEKVNQIRLENIGILKISHLGILPNLTKLSLTYNHIEKIEQLDVLINLKELDLSFNYICKIENLDKLIKLEVLRLYSNSIEKLENLDSLTNLMILSAGRNKICTLDGIGRLRFLEKLQSLNLEENPIAFMPDLPLRPYLAAFLPQLRYYNYISIKMSDRTTGGEIFRRELRDVLKNEKDEITQRYQNEKNTRDEIRLSDSFVEFLNERQLFYSLFENDINGKTLMMIGEEAQELFDKYNTEVFILTQKIYELGLEKYQERCEEIIEFNTSLNEGKVSIQKIGQEVIDSLTFQKCLIYKNLNGIFDELDNMEKNNIIDVQTKLQDNDAEFNKLIEMSWKILMEIEINLFERIQEAIKTFGHNITDMVNEFIEQAQAFFVQIREAENNFCDGIQEATNRYIIHKTTFQLEHTVPLELKECLENKEIISNFVSRMREHHTSLLDSREERLVTKSLAWVNDAITNLQRNEVKRNRSKVCEINYFLDQQKENFRKHIESYNYEN